MGSGTSYTMESSRKFCLRLSEFESNVRKSFKALLKEENNYSDVTLASDDGKQMKAHKIILAAGSVTMDKMLRNIDHPHPYIFMKGIQSIDLECIISFLYNGEAYVEEMSLDRFFDIAEDLGVKGLQGYRTGKNDKVGEPKCSEDPELSTMKEESGDINPLDEIFNEVPNNIENVGEDEDLETSLYSKEEQTIVVSNDELDDKIDQMMERNGKSWICKTCGKISDKKFLIKEHVETHIQGAAQVCHICNKTSATRKSLKIHIIDFHNDKSFTCKICGKEGMKKMTYKTHKKKCTEDSFYVSARRSKNKE